MKFWWAFKVYYWQSQYIHWATAQKFKNIYWYVHLLTFSRSLFKAITDKFVSRTTENREVSGFDDNSLDKSLIKVKNNKGPKIEPCGAPALHVAVLETCPFKTTLWYPFAEKSSMIFSKIPDIPLSFNFSNKPSDKFCQKLLIYWEKHLLLPNHHQMTYKFHGVINKSWLMQESTCLKLDRFWDIKLFSMKKITSCVQQRFRDFPAYRKNMSTNKEICLFSWHCLYKLIMHLS